MRPPLKKGSPDDYQTDPQSLDLIAPYLSGFKTVWECACGKGYLAKALKKRGHKVIATDKEKDFLKWKPKNFDLILTNPPYSLKNQFLERASELDKPFAFLLPLTTLETQRRQRVLAKGIEVLIPKSRLDFEKTDGKFGKTWFATAWFTRGLGIGKQLTFEIEND